MTVPHHSEPAREAVALDQRALSAARKVYNESLNIDIGALGATERIVRAYVSASPAPAAGGLEAVREALVEAEAAFEAIRIILVNELEEPVRGAFWRAVQARDASRAALAAAAASRGEDWRPVLTGMVAAMNKRDSDFGDGEIPSAHRSLMWRAEQLLASPAATSAETQGGDGVRALPYLIHFVRHRWGRQWTYTVEQAIERWLSGEFHADAAESDAKAAASPWRTPMIDEKAVARAIAREMHKGGDFGMDGDFAYETRPAEFLALARAAIAALSPGSTGETEGWVLVPKELTEAMREATWRDQYQSAAGQHGMATDVVNECVRLKMVDAEQADQDRSAYRAMLSAAGGR